jgi:hypothetical protein
VIAPVALAAGTLGLCTVPLAVAAVAAPINGRRDRRRHDRRTADERSRTAVMVEQLYIGAALAADAGDHPADIAAAACEAATVLDGYFAGQPNPFLRHTVSTLTQILAGHGHDGQAPPVPEDTSPLAVAAALRIGLDRLTACHREPGLNRLRAHVAAGAAAEAVARYDFGRILADFELTEHDPVPVFAANTIWRTRIQAHAAETVLVGATTTTAGRTS